jgi:uncharacterized protein YdeI (YjbR/CyaY-like superfamily)
MSSVSSTYEQVQVESVEQWRGWLDAHHGSSPGIWLVTWKKHHGPYLAYGDIVDQALCYGWVDSQPRALDTDHTQRLLTPRRPGSNWSRVNQQRVHRLTAAGLMAPAGLATVEAARRDGSWHALDTVETLSEPDDLRGALDSSTAARANWDRFPRSTKRAILEWITTAKTTPTRTRRIEQTVTEAAAGRRANQWRQPKSR